MTLWDLFNARPLLTFVMFCVVCGVVSHIVSEICHALRVWAVGRSCSCREDEE